MIIKMGGIITMKLLIPLYMQQMFYQLIHNLKNQKIYLIKKEYCVDSKHL